LAARDWRRINEGLVKRGEILLDLRILDRWKVELERMNKGKEGGQYVYPEIFIKLLGYLHMLFHLPYRQTEGFLKALRRFDSRIQVPDYSTIDRRVNRLDIKLDEKDYGDDIVLAVDASGIKVSNRGEWIRHIWKIRRGYLKIHIAVDVKQKKILALKVTDEKTGDGRMLKPLVEEASRRGKVTKTIGDGAYDTKSNFRYLDEKGIEPVIKVRKNASSRAGGCMRIFRRMMSDPTGYIREYHKRQLSESAFSADKRTLGWRVWQKRDDRIDTAIGCHATLHNLLRMSHH
jgi:IS5 family transposase